MSSKLRVLAALLASLAVSSAAAQYQGKIALDQSIFGTGGFTAVPALDPSNPAITPIGFVRMLGGGYIYFSVQQIGANTRVVATRFTDNGTLNIFWGAPTSPGSVVLALPVPSAATIGSPSPAAGGAIAGVDAKLATVMEGSPARERVYLAMKFTSGASHQLGVARLDADGTFVSFDSSTMGSWFAGVGSVTAVAASDHLYADTPGVLVAVSGFGGITGEGAALIRVLDGIIFDSPVIGPLSPVVLPGQRIKQMVFQPFGKADLVGHEGSMALYREYNPTTNTVSPTRTFALPCPSGTHAGSTIDGIVRPSALAVNDGLVVGRVNCTSEAHIMLARVTNIGIAPGIAWGTSMGGIPSSPCSLFAIPCLNSFIATSATMPGRAYVGSTFATPNRYPALAHVDITSVPGRVLGLDSLVLNSGSAMIVPSHALGADRNEPYLIGFGYNGASSIGFGAVAVDRIFASGMGTEWW